MTWQSEAQLKTAVDQMISGQAVARRKKTEPDTEHAPRKQQSEVKVKGTILQDVLEQKMWLKIHLQFKFWSQKMSHIHGIKIYDFP